MKRISRIVFAWILLLSGVSVSCEKPVEDNAGGGGHDKDKEEVVVPDGPFRILAIGNSFSQDAVEQYLYELFEAEGLEVVIGNLYIGGCTIDRHWDNAMNDKAAYEYRKIVDGKKTNVKGKRISEVLAEEEWNYISFQQASGSSGKEETYGKLPLLVSYVYELTKDYARKPTMMFHQAWAYSEDSDHAEFPKYDNSQKRMFTEIVQATKSAMWNNPLLKIRIPSGTAIQNGRTTWLGDTFNRDGYHLETTYGRYTAACTWFEAISKRSVVGNSYSPATVDGQKKAIAQNAAHLAVLSPDYATEMKDFKEPNTGAGPLSKAAFVDFGPQLAGEKWNNCSLYVKGAQTVYLKDEDGEYTKATLKIIGGFSSLNAGVSNAPQADVKVNGYTIPRVAWYDGLVVGGTKDAGFKDDPQGPGQIEVSGLETSVKYDITLMAIRFNGTHNVRKVEYVVHGAQDTEVKGFLPGIKNESEFNAVTDFNDYSVVFEDVMPDELGKIVIDVLGRDCGSTVIEGNVNAMVIAPAA